MKTPRFRSVLALSFFALLAFTTDSHACRCAVRDPVRTVREAGAILVGEVLWSHEQILSKTPPTESIPAQEISDSYVAIAFDEALKVNTGLSASDQEFVRTFIEDKSVLLYTGHVNTGVSCPGVSVKYPVGTKILAVFNVRDGETDIRIEGTGVSNCSWNSFIVGNEGIDRYRKIVADEN